MRRPCGAGCCQKGYGVGSGNGACIASGENGKHMWVNCYYYRWTEVSTTFIQGLRPAKVHEKPHQAITSFQRVSLVFRSWLEGRGPRGCLMNMVDDASGDTLARMGSEETIWAAGVLRAWVKKYGITVALPNHLIPNPLLGAGSARFSQGRNSLQLGIYIDPCQCKCWEPLSGAGPARNDFPVCTKSGHAPVDGLHSIENTGGYNPLFFVD
jgi:hypothetical protein